MNKVPSLIIVLPFVVGIALGYFVSFPVWILFASGILSLLCSLIISRFPGWRMLPAVVACIALGAFFMQHRKAQFEVPLPEGYASFTAILADSPQEKKSGLAGEYYVLDGDMAGQYVRLYIKNDTASLHYHGMNLQPVVPQLANTYHIRCRMKGFDGDSSYTLWARSHGYLAQGWVYPQNITPVEAVVSLPLSVRLRLKARILRQTLLWQILPDSDSDDDADSKAILAAMAFGDRSLITAELRENYSVSGASHLLALSGMHLGILFTILMLLFGKADAENNYRQSRWSRTLALWHILKQVSVIAVVWVYVMLTGMSASVLRAAIMITIYTVLSADPQREQMSVNALMVTSFVMLFADPMMLFDIGFQLSVLAMLAIFLFYPPLRETLFQWRFMYRIPGLKYVLDIMLISIAAQIGTAPLAVYHFGRFSLCFLVTNLVAIPLVTILLYAVFLFVIISITANLLHISDCLLPVTCYLKPVTYMLNTSMEYIASWGIYIDNIHINLPQMILLYVSIITIYIMSGSLRRMFLSFSAVRI